METRVASRYARALFNAGRSANILDSISADLAGVVGAIERDAKFRTFLINPQVAREQKLSLLGNVFSDRVTALTMAALRLMVEKGREELIPYVREEFDALKRDHDSVKRVKIVSDRPLSDVHREAIIQKISTATRKTVVADVSIDPNLLGGVLVEIDGYVMDGTVRGSLNRMRENLVHNLLKQN